MFSRNFQYYIDLVTILTQKEIKVRYKNSFLGYLWSVAHPLAFALTFFFVFKVIMRFPIPNYALFLIVALFPWQMFANSVNVCTTTFVASASLIKKVAFPRYFLLLAVILNDVFHFLMSIPVILLFLFLYKVATFQTFFAIAYTFLNLIPQILITLGIGLVVASVNLFFRDLERLVGIFLNLLFYFTPIIYSADVIPLEFRWLLDLNPLSLIISNWRNIWLYSMLDWHIWLNSIGLGLLLLGFGSWVYLRLNRRFSEVI